MSERSEVFDVTLTHYLDEPVAHGEVLINRVVYSFDPFSCDEHGVPFESLAFKGHKLTRAGRVRARDAGDYHYAIVPEAMETMWMAIMRDKMSVRLADAAKALNKLS